MLTIIFPLNSFALDNCLIWEWTRNVQWGGWTSGIKPDDNLTLDKYGNFYECNIDGWLYKIKKDNELDWKVFLNQKTDKASWRLGGVSPVVDGQGNCYIGSLDHKIYAIDSQGEVKWTYSMEEKVSPTTSPALDSVGTVYAVDTNHKLYAVDKTGGELWKVFLKGEGYCSTPVISETKQGVTIYVARANAVYALDSEGKIKWVYDLEDKRDELGGQFGVSVYAVQDLYSYGTIVDYERKMAVSKEGDIYLNIVDIESIRLEQGGAENNSILALNSDGTRKWHRNFSCIVSSPVHYQDKLYCSTYENIVYVLNAEDGSFIRGKDATSSEDNWFFEPENRKDDSSYNSYERDKDPVIDEEGTIYVLLMNNLYAIDSAGSQKGMYSWGDEVSTINLSQPGPKGEIYCTLSNHTICKVRDISKEQVPHEIVLQDKDFKMLAGGKYTVNLELLDEFGNSMDSTGLAWQSMNPEIITVDKEKKILPHSPGVGKIKITHPDNPNLQEIIKVTIIKQTEGMYIEVMPQDINVLVGKTVNLSARLLSPEGSEIKEEFFDWTSDLVMYAVVNEQGQVTGKAPGEAVIKVRVHNYPQIKQEVKVKVKYHEITEVTKEEIADAVKASSKYYQSRGVTSDWAAFALNALGKNLNDYVNPENHNSYIHLLPGKIERLKQGAQMTDYERTVIAMVSAGVNPLGYEEQDFVAKIYNYPSLSQGINAAIWGLVSLDATNALIPEDAVHDRESLIRYIINNRVGDGWCFSGSQPDPDMTGMALCALAPYRDRLEVKTVGEKAIQWLSANQLDNGRMSSWGSVNSESTSQTILGITAWGVDPQGPLFTKSNGNLVTGLLSYQNSDGSFNHLAGDPNGMSTEQGVEALAAITDFMEHGVSTIFYKIQSATTEIKTSSLEIYPEGLELKPGKTLQLGAKNQQGMLIDNSKLKWSISNPKVVSINDNGVITTKEVGTVNIMVELKEDADIKDQTRLEIVGTEFQIDRLKTEAISKKNSKKFAFEVKNISDRNKSAIFIFTVKDLATNKIIYIAHSGKEYIPDEINEISGDLNLPAKGNYEIKVMAWNKWLRGRPLMKAIVE